jgi:hypothetical protein
MAAPSRWVPRRLAACAPGFSCRARRPARDKIEGVPIDVEINLRIPRLTIRSASAPDKVIDNSVVRFTRLAQVPAIPKAGEPLQLAARVEGDAIDCVVTRADWSEEKELFIVSCNYSKKSIAAADYEALVNDADWTMKPLI